MIGTGFMGWAHVEALRRVGVRVVGICGSSEEKSRAAAEKLGIARAYRSYADVLADKQVHSVHNGTPNRSHFEMAKQALAAGKHVMCDTDYNWRILAEEGGELRAIADIGTHWLDLVQSITGLEVEAVCADLMTVHSVRQRPKGEVETFQSHAERQHGTEPVAITTEDYGAILLRFRGGARGCLHVSQVTPGRKNRLRLEIAGAKQSLAWNSEEPNELWIGHRDRPNQSLIRDPALLTDAARSAANYPGGHNEGYPDSFKQCFRAFYEYIRNGDFSVPPTYPTFADSHREIVLCAAVLRSHREGSWIHISDQEGA